MTGPWAFLESQSEMRHEWVESKVIYNPSIEAPSLNGVWVPYKYQLL